MAWSKHAVALVLPCLWGCTTPAPPPPKAAPLEVTPPAPPEEPAAEEPAAPPPDPGPITVELPANPACVLEGDWSARKWRTGMLARPDGPVFAEVSDGSGRLHFPSGKRPASQGLQLSADGIYVAGYVDADASDLRAAKAFWLSGLALTTPATRLDWSEAAPGQLTVTTEPPSALQVLSPPLSAVVPCPDVATKTGTFKAVSAIEGFSKAKPRELVSDRLVDIATEPGGAPVARASPGSSSVDVSLLEVRGASSRIAWEVGTLVVVGWVKSSDIHVPKGLSGYGRGYGLGGNPRYADDYKKVVCPGDVQLYAEIGVETFLTGRILAGTVIELVSANDRTTAVRVRSQSIVPASGALWTVPNPDLRDCLSPPS